MNNLRWLEIDLNNLKSNLCNLKSLLKPKTKFMAVVKSNAYGHGIVECSKAAVEAGADWLGVVNIDEAIKLRKSNIKSHIMILGYAEPKDFELAAENNISVAIVNWEQIKKIQKSKFKNKNESLKLKIHLKIETGISRLGFTENEWPKLIEEIKILPKNIIIEGIYSHFASVEEYDIAYAQKQIDKFKKFKKIFDSNFTPYALPPKPIYHMAASAATMILPESHFDMVRCGIATYGLWPSKEIKNLKLKNKNCGTDFLMPILSYKTKIVQIKNVKRGDYIGYGCTYPVDKPMTIAIIPVGYAEGFNRGFSNPAPSGRKSGEIIIKNTKCPIIGRICMNMAIIDISKLVSKISIESIYKLYYEEVVLLGKQNSQEITADEWADKLGTINYEITTCLPENIKRIHKNKGGI